MAKKEAFFDEIVNFRLRKEEREKALAIIKLNKFRYDNESHFYRVAVLQLIRKELHEV